MAQKALYFSAGCFVATSAGFLRWLSYKKERTQESSPDEFDDQKLQKATMTIAHSLSGLLLAASINVGDK